MQRKLGHLRLDYFKPQAFRGISRAHVEKTTVTTPKFYSLHCILVSEDG
jgi:hypothetical protein